MEGVFKVSPKELSLSSTLACGQCFRWRLRKPLPLQLDSGVEVWFGVIKSMVFELRQNEKDEVVHWKLLNTSLKGNKKRKKITNKDINDALIDYFQLDVPLEKLYIKWSKIDENFASKACKLPGIRMLRQDPVENLFSFICSSCNNIPRITSMVESMCTLYGEELFEDEEFGSIHQFPAIKNLAKNDVEAILRKMNFGYRAKFINQAAKAIMEKEKLSGNWLYNLRIKTYEEAHLELQKLPGVGAKVADCVCLMSLDKHEAIPVDTHVWKIALESYLPHLRKTKSMTDKSYREVSEFFRQHFGHYSGWAHSILFAADLKSFKEKIK